MAGTAPAEERPRWRLIVDGAADGAWNMAVDEALLEACRANPASTPTLRLYGWEPPALSLGRWQDAARSHDPAFLAAEGIDLVRRPTGGRAVLHEHERTYSVTGRVGQPPLVGGVVATYGRIAAALVAALRELGIDVAEAGRRQPAGPRTEEAACFREVSTHEITSGGRKLVGSAQLRRRGGLLQHGSIPLRADARRLGRALGAAAEPSAQGRFIDLESALRGGLDRARLDGALAGAFERQLGVSLAPGGLSAEERRHAESLARHKYRSAGWTLDGLEPPGAA